MIDDVRTCEVCGGSIEHLRGDARYCGSTCRYRAWEAAHPQDAARRRAQRLAAYRAGRSPKDTRREIDRDSTRTRVPTGLTDEEVIAWVRRAEGAKRAKQEAES